MLSLVDEAKERREKHGSFKGVCVHYVSLYLSPRPDTIQPISPEDTRKLVAAYLYGSGDHFKLFEPIIMMYYVAGLQPLSTSRQSALTGKSQQQQQQARTSE